MFPGAAKFTGTQLPMREREGMRERRGQEIFLGTHLMITVWTEK